MELEFVAANAPPKKFFSFSGRAGVGDKEYNGLISNIIQITPARLKNKAFQKRYDFFYNDIDWQHLLLGEKKTFHPMKSTPNHHRLWIVWMWTRWGKDKPKKYFALNCNQFISKFIIYLPYENTVVLINTHTHSGRFRGILFVKLPLYSVMDIHWNDGRELAQNN